MSGLATLYHKWITVASIFQIGISRNTKCALKDGFCKSSHIYCFNYLQFRNFTAVKQQLGPTDMHCPHHGHSATIKRLFSEALHRLGQQLKGLECLEALSSKPNFCRDDICIREKSVQKCIDQRLWINWDDVINYDIICNINYNDIIRVLSAITSQYKNGSIMGGNVQRSYGEINVALCSPWAMQENTLGRHINYFPM